MEVPHVRDLTTIPQLSVSEAVWRDAVDGSLCFTSVFCVRVEICNMFYIELIFWVISSGWSPQTITDAHAVINLRLKRKRQKNVKMF